MTIMGETEFVQSLERGLAVIRAFDNRHVPSEMSFVPDGRPSQQADELLSSA